jgi:thioesterase domain-containing protein/acyl carrier protein
LHDAAASRTPSPQDLRAFLQRALPDFMVPRLVIVLDALPLNVNGKVDRHALPALPSRDAATDPDRVAPRDDVELAMATLFAEVLELDEPVGITDDFFDLGGHSLLAVRLLWRGEQALGLRLPLSVLFEQPTVEHLASAVREQQTEPSAPTITVPVQPVGSQPPLFCVHFEEGPLIAMRHLIPALGPDQPVFGLWTPQLVRGDRYGRPIEDVAASSIAGMREVQPQGPYFIFGYCVGGLVAWEMARQLDAAAEDVRLLVLLDTVCPGTATWWLSQWLSFVRHQLSKSPREAARSVLRRVNRMSALRRIRRTRAPHAELQWQAILRHNREYRASRITAPVTLFSSTASVAVCGSPLLGWRRLLPRDVEVVVLPGDHGSIVRTPTINTLAKRLAMQLRRAQEAR